MNRARATDVVAWVLGILLAVVFLGAGLPKLVGANTLGLQAAAMRGFPAWLRVLTGIVEVLGALLLLVPRVTAFAASALALLMIPATLTQRTSGEPGLFVPVVLFVLLVVLAWLRTPDSMRQAYRDFVTRPRPIVREGVAAGLIGATCIAVWFFGVDLIAGRPLFTPATLGRALIAVLGPVPAGESMALHVVVYTVFHYTAFIVVGIAAALLVHMAIDEPSVLRGLVVLFVAFEVGFYAFVALLQQATPLGGLAWPQVMIGNLIAAAAMGMYLVHAHPVLKARLVEAYR